MGMQLKVGSVVRVPVPPGFAVQTSDPGTITATMTAAELVLTGVKAGVAILTVTWPSDAVTVFKVTVTPT